MTNTFLHEVKGVKKWQIIVCDTIFETFRFRPVVPLFVPKLNPSNSIAISLLAYRGRRVGGEIDLLCATIVHQPKSQNRKYDIYASSKTPVYFLVDFFTMILFPRITLALGA